MKLTQIALSSLMILSATVALAQRPLPPGPPPPPSTNPPSQPPPPPIQLEIIDVRSLDVVPFDVCLDGLRSAYGDIWGDRTRINGTVDFCDWRSNFGGLSTCTYPQKPNDGIVNTYWSGGSANLSLSNQGGATKTSIKSTELQTYRSFYDAAAGSPNPNCQEAAGTYRVQVDRYLSTRDRASGREISRSYLGGGTTFVNGHRLVRESVWDYNDNTTATGQTKTSDFEVDVQPYETQLKLTFNATLTHTYGNDARLTFASDRFFTHTANQGNTPNGGTISVSTQISPINSPSVAISSADTKKTQSTLNPLIINDPELPGLLQMDPNLETTYTLEVYLERDKFGPNEPLKTVVGQVVNTAKTATLNVDVEAALANSGQSLGLDRVKNDYVMKITAQATRSNSKFVLPGASGATKQIEMKLEKLKH